MTGKQAIVFSSDEAFIPLAKGLVLSLLAAGYPNDAVDLCFIDIGCAKATLEWMRARGVITFGFDEAKLNAGTPSLQANYMKAQVCRPYIPQAIPGYSAYLWIDSDAWVQRRDSIELAFSIALSEPGKAAIAPFLDCSYSFNYASEEEENYSVFLKYFHNWYKVSYGNAVAERWRGRALFSSGFFAMQAKCPIWSLWTAEVATVYSRDYTGYPFELHLAEQTALNHVLYSTGGFVPLEAIHNYNCHVGAVERDGATGDVVISHPPRRPLGIVHLSYSSKMMPAYRERGLLWEQGAYLSRAEEAAISKIGHY